MRKFPRQADCLTPVINRLKQGPFIATNWAEICVSYHSFSQIIYRLRKMGYNIQSAGSPGRPHTYTLIEPKELPDDTLEDCVPCKGQGKLLISI